MNGIEEKSKIIKYETGMTPNKAKKKRKRKLSLTPDNILSGIIMSEILGKPKGRKRLVSQNELKGSNRR